ncbi:uncharacterized protein LOC119784708 isoform X2 [Cyprinodon tularosa]|uniref:uncharacterized protein LOC119784708 isoform X2 n=1 Tax=Cyprinodon tularosa TaxID=77115 RepID=UPI0018E25508|nr:uncharacterized protein LOC119784708 isoform X2 [Cyprinodon tularosa]
MDPNILNSGHIIDSIGIEKQKQIVEKLIHLSSEKQDNLNNFNLSLCEEKIQELSNLIQNPNGNFLITDVLCELTLLYQLKYQIKAKQYSELEAKYQMICHRVSAANILLSGADKIKDPCGQTDHASEQKVTLLSQELCNKQSKQTLNQQEVTPVEGRTVPEADTKSLNSELTLNRSEDVQSQSSVADREKQVDHLVNSSSLKFCKGQPCKPISDSHSADRASSAKVHTLKNSEENQSPLCHQRLAQNPPPLNEQNQLPDGPGPPSDHRIQQLESLAKDIDIFDPESQHSNIADYLQEVEHCLKDLPFPSSHEKLKLIWKTTARSVHVFIKSLPPKIRESYSALCQTLREEYSGYRDPALATLEASLVLQGEHETPREYYFRLRQVYFEGCSSPDIDEEDPTFKALFIQNLHENVRYDVAMHCRIENLSIQETRRYAQLVWEIRLKSDRFQSKLRVFNLQTKNRTRNRHRFSSPVVHQDEGHKPSHHNAKPKVYTGKGGYQQATETTTKENLELICKTVLTELLASLTNHKVLQFQANGKTYHIQEYDSS